MDLKNTDGTLEVTAYHVNLDLYYQIIGEDKNLVALGGQAALNPNYLRTRPSQPCQMPPATTASAMKEQSSRQSSATTKIHF